MADSTISPNMNMPIPTVGQAPGPTWAQLLDICLDTIDAHTHSSGSGVQITPDGININSDLTFNNTSNAIDLRTARFKTQTSPIPASGTDLACLYAAGVDLYYNDAAGNQIRITSGGSVAGSSGTITGLPSGTASASFQSSSGSFVFQQATSTGANIDVASVAIRYPGSYPTPSGNYVQLQAPSSLATGYAITLPAAPPAAVGAWLTSDTAGTLSYTNVDNTTVEINASLLRVKALGIGTTQLANGAVTPDKMAAVGQQISSSVGSFSTTSTSFVDVTNLTVTLTTTGRPVALGLISDGNGTDPSFIQGVTSSAGRAAQAFVQILEGSTSIALSVLNSDTSSSAEQISAPPGVIYHLYVPAAGTYTYKVQMKSGDALVTSTIERCKLFAYQI